MKPMLVIDGKCYGFVEWHKPKCGELYLGVSGVRQKVCTAQHDFDNTYQWTLTLLPDDDPRVVAHRLGVALFESMSADAQERATGELRAGKIDEYIFDTYKEQGRIRQLRGYTTGCYPILRPPAPKPKSDRDVLKELSASWASGPDGHWFDKMKGLKQHLADTADTK